MPRLLPLLLLAATGGAVHLDYCPIPRTILEARRFAQRPLGDCVHNQEREARLILAGRPIVFRMRDGWTEISGQTSPGKPWRVRTGAFTLGCSAIAADFDRNGRADLLIGTGNFGTSLAPWSRLFFLLFDASGHPVPWQMYGFFSESRGKTVEDLLDLNGDGRAELLDLQSDERASMRLEMRIGAAWKGVSAASAFRTWSVRRSRRSVRQSRRGYPIKRTFCPPRRSPSPR